MLYKKTGEYAERIIFVTFVQMAEAAANFLHAHIRRELKLALNRGKRYSWGYPAIPGGRSSKGLCALTDRRAWG